MSHSRLNRLLPILLVVPAITVATPVAAHAAVTCDPLEVSASAPPGAGETVTFTMQNCTALTQVIVLSGKRIPPALCPGSGLNFGDSPPIRLRAHHLKKFFHGAPDPHCKGVYTVKGDSEVKGETVLDNDVTTYTVG